MRINKTCFLLVFLSLTSSFLFSQNEELQVDELLVVGTGLSGTNPTGGDNGTIHTKTLAVNRRIFTNYSNNINSSGIGKVLRFQISTPPGSSSVNSFDVTVNITDRVRRGSVDYLGNFSFNGVAFSRGNGERGVALDCVEVTLNRPRRTSAYSYLIDAQIVVDNDGAFNLEITTDHSNRNHFFSCELVLSKSNGSLSTSGIQAISESVTSYTASPNLSAFRNHKGKLSLSSPFLEVGSDYPAGSGSQHIYFGSGSVGIGTDDPGEDRLSVNGTIKSKEVKVTVEGWPDYVFKENYELMPLKELEAYIKRHQHLPNIPTETEVLANGLSLGEINIKLLEKVEELTLYLLQKDKQLSAVEAELQELKKAVESLK